MIPEMNHLPFDCPVIFEDEALLVVNKPAGVLSVPGGFSPNVPDLRTILEPLYGPLWIVHRLDKDTSGVVVLARTAETHRRLNLQFDNHVISKEYRAVVYGQPGWSSCEFDQLLLVNGDRNHRTIASKLGKSARTDFQVLHRFPCFTYMAAFPHTGLTHQIRAHLSILGFPILMDELYGKSKLLPSDADLINRMALHAIQIQFIHPLTQKPLSISAPLSPDIRNVLDKVAFIETHDTDDYNAIYNTVVHQVGVNRKKNKFRQNNQ